MKSKSKSQHQQTESHHEQRMDRYTQDSQLQIQERCLPLTGCVN